MLFPSSCPACARPGFDVCAPCRAALVPSDAVVPPLGVDSCAALWSYEGVGAQIVTAIKYRNARSVLPWLGAAIAAMVPSDTTMVTWAATTPGRRRRRGFDQAELIARAVARSARSGAPLRDRRPCAVKRSAATGRYSPHA